MLTARITFDRRWRWRGIGFHQKFKPLGRVDRLPECLNAADVQAEILRVGPFREIVDSIDESFTRWIGRFRVEVDARGRTITVERHAYDFGFKELLKMQALLKKLRFAPARRTGRAVNYDFAVNVALYTRKGRQRTS